MEETTVSRTVWECANGIMYHTAYEVLRNRADAEDAVMDAMYRIVQNEEKFDGLTECDMRTLAVICARRAAIDIYRKNRKRPYPMDELPENTGLKDSPEEIVASKDSADRLLQLIRRQMPPSYRDVLLLRCRYGMNDREIADMLGIKGGTVRTRLNRARTWLKEKLAEKEEGSDE